MYVGRDFSVSDGGYEVEAYGFDFSASIATPRDTMTAAAFTLAVVAGADPGAAGRILGPAVIKNQSASAPVGQLVPGVKYRLQCVATFASGKQLSLYSFVLAVPLRTGA